MKKRLSAFTLIETIIVMAIFSMIMFSVMQLMDPVSKYFVRGSNFENSTACLDNMRRCIEGNMMFADRIHAYAGFEPYHYTDSTDINGDGVDGDVPVAVKTSNYAPSNALKKQVEYFHDTFFKNRVCFDAAGTIYVLCFDNTQIISDEAMKSIAALDDYNDFHLNQGKILLYGFDFDINREGDGTVVYNVDLDNPTITQWTVNQKLYGNFDYTFYLGINGEKDGDDGKKVAITDPTELVNGYAMQFNDCKIHIRVDEVKRRKEGGLQRVGQFSSYQNTYASFILRNALQYDSKTETKFTNVAKTDVKILYDQTKKYNDISAYTRVGIDQVLPLMKIGGAGATENKDLATGQSGTSSSFYFIFTTPDSCTNVDPTQWGITVS